MAEFENYVTRKYIKKVFGVSERTIVRWLANDCPCIRIGRNGTGDPRFRISDVDAWLETRAEVAKR